MFLIFLVPCGPGQFYQNGNCISCPDGQYQDEEDGTCKECDPRHTPNKNKTDCISKILQMILDNQPFTIINHYTCHN